VKFVRVFLQCVGAIALVLLLALAVYAFSKFSGPRKSTDKDDAIFVLNWAGLDTKQQWKIIDGSISSRNITGDHADYYCIQLEDVSLNGANSVEWKPGPETNELLAGALEQAIGWARQGGADCFPSFEVANSDQMKILFWSMNAHGRNPAGAQILLLQPSTKRLFYVSFAT
jgi:hypothetical protein